MNNLTLLMKIINSNKSNHKDGTNSNKCFDNVKISFC